MASKYAGLTEEQMLEAVKESNRPSIIKYFDTQSPEVQMAAVTKNPQAIKYIKNPTDEVQEIAVKKSPRLIYKIKNPCEEAQLCAVEGIKDREHDRLYKYLGDPPESVKLAFVNNDGYYNEFIIGCMDNPSEDIQLISVDKCPYSISRIDNPTPAVQLLAVQKDFTTIRFIKNPSEELQKIAVDEQSKNFGVETMDMVFVNVSNPSDYVLEISAQALGFLPSILDNPSFDEQRIAMQHTPWAYHLFKNKPHPIAEFQWWFLRFSSAHDTEIQLFTGIRFINDPIPEIQIYVAKKFSKIEFRHIKNPCDDAIIAFMDRWWDKEEYDFYIRNREDKISDYLKREINRLKLIKGPLK